MSRGAASGLILLCALFLLAVVGPRLTPWHYADVDFTAFSEPPSAGHWFGTTAAGRDVYALTLRGLRRSLIIALVVAVLSTGAAAVVGTAAGYFGGWVDRALMWVVDLLLVLPVFLVVAIASPLFRNGSWLLLAAFLWMISARAVRGATLSLTEQEYVLAARCLGASPIRIIVRHIVPNLAALLIIDATLSMSAAVVAETGLSYFGLGVQPPDISLGTVLADGTAAAVGYPWMFSFAAGLLLLVVLAVNLIGDGLRDALDPTAHRSRQ
jgi:peptide/nickel transport system permease protein